MIAITIDGVRLEVEDNANVLECALNNGIYIPHLCHHPDLPENGSCRMCIAACEANAVIQTSGRVPKLPARLTRVGKFNKRR